MQAAKVHELLLNLLVSCSLEHGRDRLIINASNMHTAVESDVYNGYYIPEDIRVLLESMMIRQTGATIFRIFGTDDSRPYVLLNPIQGDVA